MTEVILKDNEFIIRLDNEDIFNLIEGKEEAKLQLINPHKENYNSNSLQILKLLLMQIDKPKI